MLEIGICHLNDIPQILRSRPSSLSPPCTKSSYIFNVLLTLSRVPPSSRHPPRHLGVSMASATYLLISSIWTPPPKLWNQWGHFPDKSCLWSLRGILFPGQLSSHSRESSGGEDSRRITFLSSIRPYSIKEIGPALIFSPISSYRKQDASK